MSTLGRDGTKLTQAVRFQQRERLVRVTEYLFLLVSFVAILFPVYWTFTSSIRRTETIRTTNVQLLSTALTLDHYRVLLFETNFLTWLFNSLVVAAGVIVLTSVFATLGGYGLARLNVAFKLTFARGVLLGYMFPPILLGIPMYVIWRQIGVLNSHFGLILAETALALPFSLWLMWNFFQTVPYSLEESAQMAGATRFQALIDIALPMAKPGLAAIAVFSFAVSWNEFTLADILITANDKFVLTTGLYTLIDDNLVPWGPMMAGVSITILPAILLVYFLQKYLLSGFQVVR